MKQMVDTNINDKQMVQIQILQNGEGNEHLQKKNCDFDLQTNVSLYGYNTNEYVDDVRRFNMSRSKVKFVTQN